MREIKFRFYSKHLGRFVKPDDSIFVGALKDPDMNPMQYTGLKDKNGVEIYEGYIVMAEDYGNLDIGEWTGEVKMGNFNGAWCLQRTVDVNAIKPGSVTQPIGIPILHFINFNAGLVPESKFEVIGNIYENGDLLK